jgi:hypothetical protein
MAEIPAKGGKHPPGGSDAQKKRAARGDALSAIDV